MSRTRTLLIRPERHAHAADTGLWATLGTMTIVGALALGASALDRLAATAATPDASADDAVSTIAPAIAPPLLDTAHVTAAPLPLHGRTRITAVPSAELETLTADETALLAPVELAPPVRMGLDLSQRHARWRNGGPVRAAAPSPSGGRSLDAMAKGWVPDWRAPSTGDLSLFVAADDEALTWALSSDSPNSGRVTYQDDRVEVGELSAGVAISLADSQIALAYLERDAPTQFGYATRENMAGVVWTLRR